MARFLLRRLVLLAITLWIVSALMFVMSRIAGDPRLMYLRPGVTQEMWDDWGREMGLDRPLVVQYLVWAGKAIRGDLGNSIWARRPVTEVIAEKLPATLLLGSSTFLFILVGVPLGVMSAVQRGSISDYAGRIFAVMGLALPPFWVGLMLILIFSVQLDWLPPGKRGGIQHFILPSITLGWGFAAGILRLVRSSLLDVLDSEYIKLARAKGVSRGSRRLEACLQECLYTTSYLWRPAASEPVHRGCSDRVRIRLARSWQTRRRCSNGPERLSDAVRPRDAVYLNVCHIQSGCRCNLRLHRSPDQVLVTRAKDVQTCPTCTTAHRCHRQADNMVSEVPPLAGDTRWHPPAFCSDGCVRPIYFSPWTHGGRDPRPTGAACLAEGRFCRIYLGSRSSG